MKYPLNLRWGRLLRTIFAGGVIGLIGGYASEFFLNRYGVQLPVRWLLPLFGVCVGILSAVCSFIVARRGVFEYLRSLRDSLRESEQVSPGISDEPNLGHRTSSLFQYVEDELSDLQKDRERVSQLIAETSEILESNDFFSDGKLRSAEQTIDARIEKLERLQQDAQELNQWYKANLEPLFTDEWPSFQDADLDSFEEMVKFHTELEDRLQESLNEMEKWDEVVEPWQKGPARIRSEIKRANQLLLTMGELFREFPDENLPETAESLREHTQSWEDLADQIEQGITQLQTVSREVVESLESLRQRTRDSAPSRSAWDQVRVVTERVDNKVDDLRQRVDGNWAEKLNSHFRSLQRETDRLSEVARTQKETLKDQQKQVEIITSLFQKWKRVLDSDSTTENTDDQAS